MGRIFKIKNVSIWAVVLYKISRRNKRTKQNKKYKNGDSSFMSRESPSEGAIYLQNNPFSEAEEAGWARWCSRVAQKDHHQRLEWLPSNCYNYLNNHEELWVTRPEPPALECHQSAYSANKSTEDVIATALYAALSPLEEQKEPGKARFYGFQLCFQNSPSPQTGIQELEGGV